MATTRYVVCRTSRGQSAIKKVDVAVFDTIKNATKDVYHGGGNTFFTLANGGAGLGKINPRVPGSIVAKVNDAADRIRSGEIVPRTTVGS